MRAQSALTSFALCTLMALTPTAAFAEPPVPPTHTVLPMDGHPLYFAVELKKDGQVVGRPKLLGVEGKRLAVEKKQPGASGFDYRLVLFPHQVGDKYELTLDVAVPGMNYHYDLQLLHGEVQKVGGPQKTGAKGVGFEVELLVLKVDSPEFRALMELTRAPGPQPSI